MRDDEAWTVRKEAVVTLNAIVNAGGADLVRSVVPTLADMVVDSGVDIKERNGAAQVLEAFGPDAALAAPALGEAFGPKMFVDKFESLWVWAARALGSMGTEAAAVAVDQLVEALQTDHCEVRVFAANFLGRLGSGAKKAVPALVTAMSKSLDERRVDQRQCPGYYLLDTTLPPNGATRKMTFKPAAGGPGFRFDGEGLVGHVDYEGQAYLSGNVWRGMKIVKVEDKEYSERVLNAYILSNRSYNIIFQEPSVRAEGPIADWMLPGLMDPADGVDDSFVRPQLWYFPAVCAHALGAIGENAQGQGVKWVLTRALTDKDARAEAWAALKAIIWTK
jgi:hypothetical protein